MARKIEVVAYRPEWEKFYREEAHKIKVILGKNCLSIYHIGSTAVKGLAAKPILDIMPVVKDISLVDAHNKEFEALGYECMGEFGIPGRRFFKKGGDLRTHHVHIFENQNTSAINRHLAVRNYLKSHPAEAAAYGDLKKKLAAQFPFDNDGYCQGKDAFVKELELKSVLWSQNQAHQSYCIAIGMCFGSAAGMVLGATLHQNIGIGMCLGIPIGMLVGLGIGSFNRKT